MKANTKLMRLLSLVLCLLLCLSLMPTVLAAETDTESGSDSAAAYTVDGIRDHPNLPVNEITISGLQFPEVGETVAENLANVLVSPYAECDLSWIYWYTDNGTGSAWHIMEDNEQFKYGYTYYYKLAITCTTGYYFPYSSSAGEDGWYPYSGTLTAGTELPYHFSKIYYNPDDPDNDMTDSLGIIGDTFELSASFIDGVVISGLRTPVAGETSEDNLRDVSIPDGHYYFEDLYWLESSDRKNWRKMEVDDVFEVGKYYRYRALLVTDSGYAFDYGNPIYTGNKYWFTYSGTTKTDLPYEYSAVIVDRSSDYHLMLDVSGKKFRLSAFTDVPTGSYYEDAVNWAVDHNITNGTSPTTFSPNSKCTRGQIVTFLWRICGCPEPKTTTCSFKDVSKSEYYYKAVLWAVEAGVTNGTSPTTFSPNAACTRAQAMTFLWRTAKKPEATGSTGTFKDVPSGAYYEEAVQWAVGKGITNGTSPTTFSPDQACTRAHIVTFIYRYMMSAS